jgi:tetratricopeptide (TPR) repeat protein
MGSIEDFAPFVLQARKSALQALALDSENPQTQYVLAQTSLWAGDVRGAIAHASRAIELNGNFALGHFYLGIALSLDCRHEEALEAIETGWRLSPRDPRASSWLANKARVFYHLEHDPKSLNQRRYFRRRGFVIQDAGWGWGPASNGKTLFTGPAQSRCEFCGERSHLPGDGGAVWSECGQRGEVVAALARQWHCCGQAMLRLIRTAGAKLFLQAEPIAWLADHPQ